MAAYIARMSGIAGAVGVAAPVISGGNMAAAGKMTRPSEMRAAASMSNRSVAAAANGRLPRRGRRHHRYGPVLMPVLRPPEPVLAR